MIYINNGWKPFQRENREKPYIILTIMQGYRRSRKEFSWSRCTVDNNVEFSLIKVTVRRSGALHSWENIVNLAASRRCLWARTKVSSVWWSASSIISKSELQSNRVDKIKVTKTYTKTSYATLHNQWHRPMWKQFIKLPYSISRATSIESVF